jgi:transcriptional regulator with XRE-family HTH domain
MAQAHSPTIRARRLGSYLQQLRDEHGLSFAAVAARIDVHHTTVRRIEKGLHKTDIAVITELLDIYGVDHARRLELLDLADNAFRRGWWLEYPELDGMFLAFEDEASLIRNWQTSLVPGLLQTEGYARALIATAVPPLPSDEVEKRVRGRLERQDLLSRENGPQLHAILSEAVLRQQVGGPEVMRDQLDHFLKAGERDNVTVQVLPFGSGANVGLCGSFALLGFAHPSDPDVAYTENLSGSVYPESEAALTRFRMAWGDVADDALSPDESAAYISRTRR